MNYSQKRKIVESSLDSLREERTELKRTIDSFWGVNEKLKTQITILKYQCIGLILLLSLCSVLILYNI